MMKATTQAAIVDAAINELTHVKEANTATVWVYAQPVWPKPECSRYILHQPRMKRGRPQPKEVLMVNAQIKRYYEGGGGNYFLLEVPASYVGIYEIGQFVLSEEHLESLKPNFDMSHAW